MSWDNSKRFHPLALGTAALLLGASLAAPMPALAGMVVAASGPSAKNFPTGTRLPDDAKITLKASDSVTILDKNGTRVLRGAGTFTVGSTLGVNRGATFAALTKQRSATRVRTGAVRASGPDGKPLRPNLWYVDLSTPGKVCVPDLAEVRAWRPEKDGAASYKITGKAGGEASAIAFADQSMVSPWDEEKAPLGDGATFAIKGPAETVTITFELLPAQDYDIEALGEALLEKGCTAQLAVLSQTLALPEG